ncbi:pyridoxamine 5'-phosphate oxidase family protein [Dietzia kunjamensis]|uniref:pyridoxamine 5'-phosphate oxidase family protein n=1 Tax=Dietzia kunjamensis TaxID=322509 RepID=UPI0032AEBF24
MSDDTRSPEQIVADLIEKSPICMITTIGPDGRLLSRPMTRQNSDFDGTLRLLAPRDGDLVSEIATNAQVNVSVQSSDGFVSVAGRAAVDDDRNAVAENWSPAVDAWFPDGSEQATSILVHADSAEYWDSSGSSIAHIASFVRAAVSRDDRAPDMGDSGTVEL